MRRALLVLLFCTAVAIASPGQIFTKLTDFDYANGAQPEGGVIQGANGNLYGTTATGGANVCFGVGCGTIFVITPKGALMTLHSFDGSDGSYPDAALVLATDGNFYGTTYTGGANGAGTVFKITSAGGLNTLHSFCAPSDCTDGSYPLAGLVQGKDGDFYGTNLTGGAKDAGTVFKITAQGALTTLYTFCSQLNCPDGRQPQGGVVQGPDGNLYGTTLQGGNQPIDCGDAGCGTIFRVTPQGVLTTLYSFCSQTNCPDGAAPSGGLVLGTDGNFYGTTSASGRNVYGTAGTVFKMTPGGALTTLYSFCEQDGCRDGKTPIAGLVLASDGNFYGTTIDGGIVEGTVFEITPYGTLTTLYKFCPQGGYCTDGAYPFAGVAQANDGRLYGVTQGGGASNNCNGGGCGTVFTLDTGHFASLSVSEEGSGLVTSVDQHIYCGGVCIYPYPKGTHVTLSAVPSPGYTFTGWTGCDQMNGSYCSVTMTSAKNVIASFTPAGVTLSSLTFKPSYVKGGQLSAGTLTLSGPAPGRGLTVALSSDHPGVAHPPSFIFISGGRSSAGFTVITFPVKSNTTVTITAAAGPSQVSGTFMVGTTAQPPSLK